MSLRKYYKQGYFVFFILSYRWFLSDFLVTLVIQKFFDVYFDCIYFLILIEGVYYSVLGAKQELSDRC